MKPMGGKREGSGRKKRFGDVPTKKILRTVPVHLIDELDEWLDTCERQLRVHGVRREPHAN